MTAATHARALVRHRQELARLVAVHASTLPYAMNEAAVLRGSQLFDVARARAYADELIALELEHTVFVEWTQTQGKGPDNRERGAFVDVETDADWSEVAPGRDIGIPRRGGWPGKLAREWGTVPCEACKGKRGSMAPDYRPEVFGLALPAESWRWCEPCKGTGRTPKPGADRRAPQGRSLARVGRRLLAALEGQPDECLGWCWSGDSSPGAVPVKDCPDCHGTGHNLRGVMPEVEVTPAMMAKCAEAWPLESQTGGALQPWARALGITRAAVDAWALARMRSPGKPHTSTRVVPRGEHRESGDEARRCLDWTPQPGENAADRNTYAWRCTPRWRRGELFHDKQRREREWITEAEARRRLEVV
jgi:hypothetical protein